MYYFNIFRIRGIWVPCWAHILSRKRRVISKLTGSLYNLFIYGAAHWVQTARPVRGDKYSSDSYVLHPEQCDKSSAYPNSCNNLISQSRYLSVGDWLMFCNNITVASYNFGYDSRSGSNAWISEIAEFIYDSVVGFCINETTRFKMGKQGLAYL